MAETSGIELKGYTTDVLLVRPTVRAPCPEHSEDGWLERARHAAEYGWPEGETGGGPWREDCAACAETPAVQLEERVAGYTTNDPRVVGLNERGEPIDARGLDPNAPDDTDTRRRSA